ncbi:MAG: prolyl oligopeptidase family serine peptidase [Chloroflexi bacterium]|nr:prolyl oligopeptidase family serine peptidase [Chloroflexota bacterium]
MTAEAPALKHWFMYFPESFMWSQGIMGAIEMAPWGAGAMGEADQVGQRLRICLGDNDAWFAEWSALADRVERRGDEEAARGHDLTAGGLYLRGCTYHFLAERFMPPTDARKVPSYRRCLRCFDEGAKRLYPRLERVEVPYEGTSLPAYFLEPEGPGPHRAMVFFGGLDSSKEGLVIYGGLELVSRGIAVLVVDGPGQGETLRLRGMPSRHDYEVPAGAAVDYLESRGDIDSKRIGIMALSMGGYYSPRAAAFEKRFKLCVAWGAHFDYHDVWVNRRRHLETGGTRASAPGHQLAWVMGAKDMDEAMEKVKPFTLAGVAEKITCPILIAHGENDSIVPVEMAYRLYDAVGSEEKELMIFTAEEGGSEHCMGDNRQLGVPIIADWIADRL